MGAGDVAGPAPPAPPVPVHFADAGRTLFSLGLVRGAEGNLSTFDGQRLLITRTGAALAELRPGDVLEGTPERPPPGASSDLELHLALYRERGPGAVAHAHPPGTVPEGAGEGVPHGRYAFGAGLDEATAAIVEEVRRAAGGGAG